RRRIEIESDVTAISSIDLFPGIDAFLVGSEQRAVVLRAAEIALAVGQNRSIVKLCNTIPVVQRFPGNSAVGRFARRLISRCNSTGGVLRLEDSAVPAYKHYLIARAVILRVENDRVLIGVRVLWNTFWPSGIVSPPI